MLPNNCHIESNNDVQFPELSESAVETLMRSHWPKVFGHGVFIPLKLRIHKDLDKLSAPLGVSKKKVKTFLESHCTSLEYIKCIASGGPRYNHDGEISGHVSPSQQKRAINIIAKVESK